MKTTSATSSLTDAMLHAQISERAYFLWLEQGCPHGLHLDHWAAAAREAAAGAHEVGHAGAGQPEGAPPAQSIRRTVADHQADPTHRFHGPGAVHDDRLNVVAGEARQRVRSRASNLQPPKGGKKSA